MDSDSAKDVTLHICGREGSVEEATGLLFMLSVTTMHLHNEMVLQRQQQNRRLQYMHRSS